MLDALRFGAAERPRLVHRLDKDTSGVLVLAQGNGAQHGFGVGSGAPAERGQCGCGSPTDMVAGVPERDHERRDGERIPDLAEGLGGGDANFHHLIVERVDKRGDPAFIPEQSQTLGGGNADVGIIIFLEGFGHMPDDGTIARRGHGFDHSHAGCHVL